MKDKGLSLSNREIPSRRFIIETINEPPQIEQT